MVTGANLESCSVGTLKGEACHKMIYCRVHKFKTRGEVSANDIRLTEWRTENISCCNPFQTHAKAFSNK